MSGHVASDNANAIFKHRQEIEVVSPGGFSGKASPGDIKAVAMRSVLRKKVLLYFARDAKLLLVLLQFFFGALSLCDITQKNDEPRFRGDLHVAVGSLNWKF